MRSKPKLMMAAIAKFLLGKRSGMTLAGNPEDIDTLKRKLYSLRKVIKDIEIHREKPVGTTGKKVKDFFSI